MKQTETDTGVMTQARETGSELITEAKQEIGAKADEARGEAAFQLREQVEQRSTQAGAQFQAVGQALRSGVGELRTDGKVASAEVVEMIASRANELGTYLQSSNADKILNDIEGLARRRPWLTAGAAAVAGFLASRVVKASSDRRYEATGSPQRSLTAGAAQ
jgi:ElaB/YqjD/DUF883 family membrane-anchored ribosome-binding protein